MAFVELHSVSCYATYPHHYPKITHDLSPEHVVVQNSNNDVDLIHTNEEDAHLNNYDQWQLTKGGSISNGATKTTPGLTTNTTTENNLYHSILHHNNNKLVHQQQQQQQRQRHNSGGRMVGGAGANKRGSGGLGGVRGLRIEDVERISKGVVTLDLGSNGKRAKEVLLLQKRDPQNDDVFHQQQNNGEKNDHPKSIKQEQDNAVPESQPDNNKPELYLRQQSCPSPVISERSPPQADQNGAIRRKRRPRKLPEIPIIAAPAPALRPARTEPRPPRPTSLAEELLASSSTPPRQRPFSLHHSPPSLRPSPPSHPSLVRAPSLADELQAADPGHSEEPPSGLPSSISFPDLPRCSIRWEDLGSPDAIEPPGLRETTSLYAFPSGSGSGSGLNYKDSGYGDSLAGLCKKNTKKDVDSDKKDESNETSKSIKSTLTQANRGDKTPIVETIPQPDDNDAATPTVEEDLDKTPKFEIVDACTSHKASNHKSLPKSDSFVNGANGANGAKTPVGGEFIEQDIYFDDQPKSATLKSKIDINFNTTAEPQKALLAPNNAFVVEDSSPDHSVGLSSTSTLKTGGLPRSPQRSPARSARSSSSSSSSTSSVLSGVRKSLGSTDKASVSSSLDLAYDEKDATHRGCHKFVPRHDDELFIEIGDPILVQLEDDDLWCEGINLRTGKRGIFPSAHATDLSFLEEDTDKSARFLLHFLGSVEVTRHKGQDVLCQAIHKVAFTRRMTLNNQPPPLCKLEINEYGIKMIDKSQKKTNVVKKSSIKQRLAKMLSKDRCEDDDENSHFFSLKNISFCGFHPRNDKYFAFITKHPLEQRFACHVYVGETSAKPISEAVGEAFTKFYQQYLAFVHPTEDIYLE